MSRTAVRGGVGGIVVLLAVFLLTGIGNARPVAQPRVLQGPPLGFGIPGNGPPDATIGQEYSYSFCRPAPAKPTAKCPHHDPGLANPDGGDGDHYILKLANTLPQGLRLSNSGVLYGTPNGRPGTYGVRICAYDSAHQFGPAVCKQTNIAVRQPPDFELQADPAPPIELVPGGPKAQVRLRIGALRGFDSKVSFDVDAPEEVNYSLAPRASRQQVVLQLWTLANANAANRTVTVTGEGGGQTHALKLAVKIRDIDLEGSPATLELTTGERTVSAKVVVSSKNGYAGPVNLALTGASATLHASLDGSATVTAGGSTEKTLTLWADQKAKLGTFPSPWARKSPRPTGDRAARVPT
jgi:hypothetical protein